MFKIHFLQTFWSDAILIEENNRFCLIDTAEESQYDIIKKSLEKYNVKTIDVLIITHFHKDHYGGAFKILDDYKVLKTYIQPYSNVEATTGDGAVATDEYRHNELNTFQALLQKISEKSELIMTPDVKEIIFNGHAFQLFYNEDLLGKAYNDQTTEYYHKYSFNENYNCLAMLMNINNVSVLFGSDMTDSNNKIEYLNMLNTKLHLAINHAVDIYKVSHHGVNWSHSEKGLAVIAPRYAVITCNMETVANRFRIIDDLKNANPNVKIFTTADKAVSFTIHDDSTITYEN